MARQSKSDNLNIVKKSSFPIHLHVIVNENMIGGRVQIFFFIKQV